MKLNKKNDKINLAVLFGGRSSEHNVSLTSAQSVVSVLDKEKYNIILLGITLDGEWVTGENAEKMLKGEQYAVEKEVFIPVGPTGNRLALINKNGDSFAGEFLSEIDVVFPVLHGSYGEDGRLQGMLEMAGIPFVGSDATASAAGMDKVLMKNIFFANGLPILPSVHFSNNDWKRDREYLFGIIKEKFELPLFVKPANTGSSVGVVKVKDFDELPEAIKFAGQFDRKILIEKGIDVREIEVSVLGNDEPIASIPGEIIPGREFYDYEAKYGDAGSELKIPADLDKEEIQKIRTMAVVAFKSLDCSGMARVDFFMDKASNEIYINELNTIPGFTPISMYPKLCEASGMSYQDLINKLIELSFARHQEKTAIKTHFSPEDK